MRSHILRLLPKYRPLQDRNHLWLIVVFLLAATALRLVSIGYVPPGLYHDEAYNGLDALKILDGDLSLYFSANNGREPMFIYLIAFWVGLLGHSPFAVRLAAFAPGLLTVAATYALARTLFSRRVGLLTAVVLSVTLWHVHLSRVGFRAVLLPLFIALTVWQGALGWRTGRRRHWLAAGALYGLSFYTYMAVRFTPLALLLFSLYSLSTRPDSRTRQWLVPLFWFGLATMVTLAPLAAFAAIHPDLVFGRTSQVAIWNPEIHGGDFWGTWIKHTTRTLGMFFIKGDRIWRHNVPSRPVFDPLLGIFFLIGLVRAIKRFRRDAAMAFLVLCVATMTLPTLLAEDAPHFLRGVGVLPLAAVLPAIGMDWFLRFSSHTSRIAHYAPYIVLIAILTVSCFSTASAYFGNYARADMTAYWFEEGAETLAGEINGFLGVGWDGQRIQHGEPGNRRVFIESGLWDTWTALAFLVAEPSAVHLLPPNGAWPTVGNGQTAIFVWPYGDWKRVWPMLNAPAEIRVREGARSQGDKDSEPYITYLAFYIAPVETVPPPMARFQGGVELIGATAELDGQVVRVTLQWHATASFENDYSVFVHYTQDGQRIGQGDAQPANGHYPTTRWRAGDVIHDDHFITLSRPPNPNQDQFLLGFYRPDNGQRLDLLDQAGNPVGTSLILPISAFEVP